MMKKIEVKKGDTITAISKIEKHHVAAFDMVSKAVCDEHKRSICANF